jgi:hypothetical protein
MSTPRLRWIACAVISVALVSRPALAQLDAPPEPPLPPPPQSPQTPATQNSQNPAPQSPQNPAPQNPPSNLAPQNPAPVNPLASPPLTRYQARVRAHRPSPEWTQDRSFTSTRFWLLDPGNFEVQSWVRTRIYDHQPTEVLLQQEVEIGLIPHLQIDLYENIVNLDANGNNNWSQEGVQLEARIAIPSYYGQLFGNPVIYLEFHPRHNQPDRAEIRLLLGGAPTRWLYLAANPYIESNVESTDIQNPVIVNGMAQIQTQTRFVADMEFGTTLAAGFRVTDWFRLSAEMKIGADMLGDIDNKLHFVWWAGPGFIVKPLKNKYLKIMGTLLIEIPPFPDPAQAQRYEPLFIVGSQF